MRQLDLINISPVYMKGDFVYKTENAVVFPQITNERNMLINIATNQFINGTVINGKLVALVKTPAFYKLFFDNTEHILNEAKGLVAFGDVVFCFYENKCLVINTATNTTKTITITAPSNIVYVYQINTFLFALITAPPTTVYIYSLDDAGNIANTADGGSIALPSYTYATFSHPKQNIRMVALEDKLYLLGSDATVELSLDVRDLVYLRTLKTYYHAVCPFQQYENVGFEFFTETLNFYVFRNTINNSTMWLSKGDGKVFFSTNTIYLTNQHAFLHSTLYTLNHIFEPATSDLPIRRSFVVKFKQNGLNGVYINMLETTAGREVIMSVLARYHNAEKLFTYTVHPNIHTYRLALKGEEFLLELTSDQALRLAELRVW